MMNWKGCRRKWLWHDVTDLELAWRDWGKPRKTLG